jgi:hypothetical protein
MTVHHPEPTRREALRRLGAAAGAVAVWPYVSERGAVAFARIQSDNAAPSLMFLTPGQYEDVARLADAIIPTDEHSPGARAARVADYIDILLAESSEDARQEWTEGLSELDRTARQRFGRPVSSLTSDQMDALLTDLSRNEGAPQTSLERFFVATKDATIRGYYTSEIGIHQDLNYQGNRFLAEFVGCTHSEHGYEPR